MRRQALSMIFCGMALLITHAAHQVHLRAQTPTDPLPKFMLSELERVKLDLIQVKLRALNAEYQLQRYALQSEVTQYVSDTMKAHNTPPGVAFDQSTLTWKTTEAVPVPAPTAQKEVRPPDK